MNLGGLGYAVDIVFVIDVTGSMHPVIDQVKQGALTFHDRLIEVMATKGKHIDQLRLRAIAYRDFHDSPTDALAETPFFPLPHDQAAFEAFVRGLVADGGGDEPETGLEALAVAVQSAWERSMDRRRHIVVVFTDASAHPLEVAVGRRIHGYPATPPSLDALSDLWDDPAGRAMEFAAKRLLLFAPDVYPWDLISSSWDNVIHFPSRAGEGLGELEMGMIIDAIAGSV